MRSSAMRDLMEITARPEVISLAGGLPDTSSFPPETFAAITDRIARDRARARSSTGPPRDSTQTKARIVEVMAAEGMRADPDDIVVTTGGQQVIDLVTKTLIDPGDVVICEAPTYPGRRADLLELRGGRDPDRDGLGRDARRPARGDARAARPRAAPAEVHLHGAHLPEPGRRDAVRAAPQPARRDRARARAAGARGQPLRPAALRGRAAAAAVRARRRRVRDLPRHVLEDPVARASGSAGSRLPDRCSRRSSSASRPPTCARSSLTQQLVDVYFEEGRWRRLRAGPVRRLPPAPRCDARRAGRVLPARGRVDAAERRAVHLGDAARLHRHR